jgi:predicted dehydrogenase
MEVVGGAFASSYHKEVEHFADCIQSGKEFRKEVTAASSKRDLKVILSAYESNKTGKVIKL